MSRRSRFGISFGAEELAALDRAFAPGAIVGDRYPAFVQKLAALEEMADDEDATNASVQDTLNTQRREQTLEANAAHTSGEEDIHAPEVPERSRSKDTSGASVPAASERQLKAVYSIGQNDCGLPRGEMDERAKDAFRGSRVSELSRQQASQFLDQLRTSAVR